MRTHLQQRPGFTYMELLIVLTIISILIFTILSYVDPVEKFEETKDVRRLLETRQIAQAIKVQQIDNGGYFAPPLNAVQRDTNYMISYVPELPQGLTCNLNCPQVESDQNCLNFYKSGIINDEYLRYIPTAPIGEVSWSNLYTGYYVSVSGRGTVTVGSCEKRDIATYR